MLEISEKDSRQDRVTGKIMTEKNVRSRAYHKAENIAVRLNLSAEEVKKKARAAGNAAVAKFLSEEGAGGDSYCSDDSAEEQLEAVCT